MEAHLRHTPWSLRQSKTALAQGSPGMEADSGFFCRGSNGVAFAYRHLYCDYGAPAPVPHGHMPIEALCQQVFLFGFQRPMFTREFEDAYNRHSDKTTTELMDLCQIAYMERRDEDSSAYALTALAAPSTIPTVPRGHPWLVFTWRRS